MVQQFKLVSLDARETRLDSLPPAEWLFNGSVREVVELLAVPVFPSHLYSDRALKYASSPSRDISKSIAYPQTRTSHPEHFPEITQQKRRKFLNEDTSQEVKSHCVNLLTLPLELIGAIFDELEIDDALRLTAAAQTFWKIGWPHMEKKLMGFMSPWAGHRLLCLGEVVEEYPPCMLSEDEKREMAAGLNADEFEDEKPHPGDPVDLYEIVYWRYKQTNDRIPPYCVSHILRNIAIHEMRTMPESLTSKVFAFTSIHRISRYYPDDQKWVLRNLTTCEFVRSEAVAGNSEQIYPKVWGFEHIVLLRIFWSSSSSNSRFNGRSVNQGVWAGHRLEIVTLDRHAKSMPSDAAWKDISEDVIEDTIQLCRAAREGWLTDNQFKKLDRQFNGRLSSLNS